MTRDWVCSTPGAVKVFSFGSGDHKDTRLLPFLHKKHYPLFVAARPQRAATNLSQRREWR
jgi:hypothetical protein